MNSLTTVERKRFEDLFGMSSGYVLSFTNPTFSELFRRTVRVDISSQKYSFNGDSKAKRLRAFWEIESDLIVGKVLSELLDVFKYEKNIDENSPEGNQYRECRKIVNRLLGKPSNELDSEKTFLEKDFGIISLSKLNLDASLVPILESRLIEANNSFKAGASLGVIFLCGSILEGILLGVASKSPIEFNKARSSPKNDSGKVKQFHEWTLSQFIDTAWELGLLKLDVKRFGHVLRDFRNYIHPYEQMISQFSPDKHTAKICLQVLNAAISDLSGDRKV